MSIETLLPTDMAFLQADRQAYVESYLGVEPNASVFDLQKEYSRTLTYLNELSKVRFTAANRVPGVSAHALPELPESQAQEIYERIEAAERLASPNLTVSGYTIGSARERDELYLAGVHTPTLLTAEHATTHLRLDKTNNLSPKEADYGTGGLGYVLYDDLQLGLILPLGRQTGDANKDPGHPVKDAIARFVYTERPSTMISLHGMSSGKFAAFNDEKAVDVMIGIGEESNEDSVVLAETVQQVCADLSLRAEVNLKFVSVDSHYPLLPKRRKSDGGIAHNRFAAAGEGTTRVYAEKVAQNHGINMATAQLELSSLLRWLPDESDTRDKYSKVMGVYLGYLVISKALAHF